MKRRWRSSLPNRSTFAPRVRRMPTRSGRDGSSVRGLRTFSLLRWIRSFGDIRWWSSASRTRGASSSMYRSFPATTSALSNGRLPAIRTITTASRTEAMRRNISCSNWARPRSWASWRASRWRSSGRPSPARTGRSITNGTASPSSFTIPTRAMRTSATGLSRWRKSTVPSWSAW